MAIIINWDSPLYHTITLQFTEDWGWLALRNQIRTAIVLMKKAPSASDLVFDLSASNGLPANPIENLDSLSHYLPANLGTIKLIVANEAMHDTLLPACEHYAEAGLHMVIALAHTEPTRDLALTTVW